MKEEEMKEEERCFVCHRAFAENGDKGRTRSAEYYKLFKKYVCNRCYAMLALTASFVSDIKG